MPSRIPLLVSVVLVSAVVVLLLSACGDKGGGATSVEIVKPKAGLNFAYVDVARAMGYTLRNRTGKDGAKEYILEAMPPGIAVGDFNGDGWFDLYCPNGNDITSYDPETKRVTMLDPAPRNELYMNRKGEHFDPVGKAAGVDDALWSYGAVAGDIDNDGDTDIYLCNFGVNRLYLNDGTGKFVDVAAKAKVAGDPRHWSTGACLVDYDKDGDLDIYVAQYADVYDMFTRSDITTILPDGKISGRNCEWKKLKVYCGPIGLKPENDVLFKSLLVETGELRFENVTKSSGIWFKLTPSSFTESSGGPFYGFQPISWDVNEDGWPDIFVANDSVANTCWINQKDGTFKDEAPLRSLHQSMTDYNPQASMGVNVGDINGDGLFDVTISEFSHDQFNLLIAERFPSGIIGFNEMAAKSGLRAETFGLLGWGTLLIDPDLDGDLDLYYACGHVYPEVDTGITQDTSYAQVNPLILIDDPATLKIRPVTADAGPGLAIKKCSRAAVAFDFDNDGDPDIATTEMNDLPVLLRCDHVGAARWISLRLVGDPKKKVPLDPAGAVVTVKAGRTQKKVLLIGSSFQCSEDPRLLFGLGEAKAIEWIEVLWPNGEKTKLDNVKPNQILKIKLGG